MTFLITASVNVIKDWSTNYPEDLPITPSDVDLINGACSAHWEHHNYEGP